MFNSFVDDFAKSMVAADLGPSANGRNRIYRPGIGPHSEPDAVSLTIQQMKRLDSGSYSSLQTQVPYPNSRQKCDLYWSTPLGDWAIEVKMIRFRGDNGKIADVSIQDILSPYPDDHSAISDCAKLMDGGFRAQRALIIYGFNDSERPLNVLVDAFEQLASFHVKLGHRHEANLPWLIHPIHSSGRVYGWEVNRLPD